jgi:hypothetical protein
MIGSVKVSLENPCRDTTRPPVFRQHAWLSGSRDRIMIELERLTLGMILIHTLVTVGEGTDLRFGVLLI